MTLLIAAVAATALSNLALAETPAKDPSAKIDTTAPTVESANPSCHDAQPSLTPAADAKKDCMMNMGEQKMAGCCSMMK